METGKRTVMNRAIVFLAVCVVTMCASWAKAATHPIYDEQADARRDVAAAISRATKTGRNVVLIFGANW